MDGLYMVKEIQGCRFSVKASKKEQLDFTAVKDTLKF